MSKDYLSKDSKCYYHLGVDAVYYNYDKKWLCKDCLEKEIERLRNDKR